MSNISHAQRQQEEQADILKTNVHHPIKHWLVKNLEIKLFLIKITFHFFFLTFPGVYSIVMVLFN